MRACTTPTTITKCCKYEKDRNPKKSFLGKIAQLNPCSRSIPCKQNTVQLSAKITKLDKSNKKLK